MAEGKFHVNNAGRVMPCSAQSGNCPFGNEDLHFSSAEDAQLFADKKNELLTLGDEFHLKSEKIVVVGKAISAGWKREDIELLSDKDINDKASEMLFKALAVDYNENLKDDGRRLVDNLRHPSSKEIDTEEKRAIYQDVKAAVFNVIKKEALNTADAAEKEVAAVDKQYLSNNKRLEEIAKEVTILADPTNFASWRVIHEEARALKETNRKLTAKRTKLEKSLREAKFTLDELGGKEPLHRDELAEMSPEKEAKLRIEVGKGIQEENNLTIKNAEEKITALDNAMQEKINEAYVFSSISFFSKIKKKDNKYFGSSKKSAEKSRDFELEKERQEARIRIINRLTNLAAPQK